MRDEFGRGAIEPTDAGFHIYLRTTLAGLPHECLHATFVGPANRYLRDEIVGRGTSLGIDFRARDLVRRALELEAVGVILAHNHPSGNSEPSADDVDATRRLAALLESLDIVLLDHLVVGCDAITSMRIAGLFGV